MIPAVRRMLQAAASVSAVILFGGVGLYALGHHRWSLADALYMAVISVSTVGFAELPALEQVPGARALTVGIILTGIGAFAYFQSTVTAFIVEGVAGNALRRNRMKKRIDALSGHVVVAGVGSTGRQVVEELVATQTPFVAIDRNHEHLEKVSAEVAGGEMLYVHGDANEDATLLAAGVERAAGVIAALTHDKDNLYVTLSARGLNARARVVSKVVEPEATAKMLRAGANATVSPNAIGGRRLANEALRPDVVEFVDQMMRERGVQFRDVAVPEGSPFAGRKMEEMGPAQRDAHVVVVATRGPDGKFRYLPPPGETLAAGTLLIVLGEDLAVARFRARVAGG